MELYCCDSMGLSIDEFYLYALSFDTQVVFAQDAYDMEFILKRLNEHYHNWRLTINTSKTEYTNSNTYFQIKASASHLLFIFINAEWK